GEGGEQGLQPHRTGRRLVIRQPLVFGRGGGVGGDDDVDQARRQRRDQRLAVALGAQRRVELGEGAVIADVELVEAQVVDRGRGEHRQAAILAALQRLQRVGRRDLVDQQ